jgi:hypothetical protein
MQIFFAALQSPRRRPSKWIPDAETSRHMAFSLHQLNMDLARPGRPGDAVIASIVSLMIHANVGGATPNAGAIHMRGLKQVISMSDYGGFARLRQRNIYLAQKIRRADLDHSMRIGSRPTFALDSDGPEVRTLRTVLQRWLQTEEDADEDDPASWREASSELLWLGRVVRALCRIAASDNDEIKLTPHDFQDVFLGLIHKLLCFAPLADQRPRRVLDDAVQLGLICFVSTLLDRHGHVQVFNMDLTGQLILEKVLDSTFVSQVDANFLLWLHFVYGLAIRLPDEERPHLTALSHAMQGVSKQAKLRDWADAKQILGSFAWVDSMHDLRGRKIWDHIFMPTVNSCDSSEEVG